MSIFTKIQCFNSSDSTVCKFVFEIKNDIAVEAVLYKYPDYETRTVLCVSTQCGCPVGCSFCGTGKFFVRSLTSEEIVEQVKCAMDKIDVQAAFIKKFQIMFMSMGEPFLNYANLKEALTTLADLYPNAQLLVSTSAPAMIKTYMADFANLCQKYSQIGLQFSVHESEDSKRQIIIPNSLPLSEIKVIGDFWSKKTQRHPFFNYCVTQENNKNENADQLNRLFNPYIWKATLSVVCEKDQLKKGTWKEQLPVVQEFARLLLENGFDVRVFNPDGQDDIGGGCGQLHYFQQFLKERQSA